MLQVARQGTTRKTKQSTTIERTARAAGTGGGAVEGVADTGSHGGIGRPGERAMPAKAMMSG
jgi:hypothetical protein